MDCFGGAGVIVWANGKSDWFTKLHVFQRGILTALRALCEVFHKGIVGIQFILINSSPPHRARLVNECKETEDIQRRVWPASSPDNPIGYISDAIGKEIANSHPPLRTYLHPRSALEEEWNLLS
ncbi:transposable element Tc1 transposase [Trichonephila clavipes]|nr:transposable element Tc1 transposase [Trichonephila clavipes]